MADGPFVSMSNHDIGGYAETTWHVTICGLPTRISVLEYPTTWGWTNRDEFLSARSGAYSVACGLAEALEIRLVEEFSMNEESGEPLPGTRVEQHD